MRTSRTQRQSPIFRLLYEARPGKSQYSSDNDYPLNRRRITRPKIIIVFSPPNSGCSKQKLLKHHLVKSLSAERPGPLPGGGGGAAPEDNLAAWQH